MFKEKCKAHCKFSARSYIAELSARSYIAELSTQIKGFYAKYIFPASINFIYGPHLGIRA